MGCINTKVEKTTSREFIVTEENKEMTALDIVKPEMITTVPNQYKLMPAKVIDVYDGDTCTIVFSYGTEFIKLKLRLLGIDTPETKPKKKKVPDKNMRILQKKASLVVTEYVRKILLNEIVIVQLMKWGKYGGRVLGEIYLSNSSFDTLSELLLSKKYAKSYHGNKKGKWLKEELDYIINNGSTQENN